MRILWIDYLRALSALAVVALHVTAPFYTRFARIPVGDWWTANIINSSARFAVPVFMMLSGALLLGRPATIAAFYKKRAARLLPPFLFWTAFYILFSSSQEPHFLDAVLHSLKFNLLISGKAYYHLWFLTTFLCLMLFAPFINAYITGEKPDFRQYSALFLVILVFSALNQLSPALAVWKNASINWHTDFIWYIVYFVSGYFLDRYGQGIRISSASLLVVSAALVGIGAVLNRVMADTGGCPDDTCVLMSNGIFVLLLSTAVFLMFRKNGHLLRKNALVALAADASFGVYLVHPFFLHYARKIPDYFSNGLLFIPLSLVLVFSASLLSIALMRRLRLLRLIC